MPARSRLILARAPAGASSDSCAQKENGKGQLRRESAGMPQVNGNGNENENGHGKEGSATG